MSSNSESRFDAPGSQSQPKRKGRLVPTATRSFNVLSPLQKQQQNQQPSVPPPDLHSLLMMGSGTSCCPSPGTPSVVAQSGPLTGGTAAIVPDAQRSSARKFAPFAAAVAIMEQEEEDEENAAIEAAATLSPMSPAGGSRRRSSLRVSGRDSPRKGLNVSFSRKLAVESPVGVEPATAK